VDAKDRLIAKMALTIEELIYRVNFDRDYAELHGTPTAITMGKEALREYEYLKGGNRRGKMAGKV